MASTENHNTDRIADLFSVGAHIGYTKASRHPTMMPYTYGVKNDREIIDLHSTLAQLDKATEMVTDIASRGKQVLFVGGKNEAHESVKHNAQQLGMPYVAGRWVGGSLTNFKQIRRQVDKLQNLRSQKEKGELAKYTKYEQLSFDREIADLERYYEGLIPLTDLPAAMVVVDPKQEQIAVHEARVKDIPVIAIANTDCDVRVVDHVIPANDNAKATIDYLLNHLGSAMAEHVSADQSTSTSTQQPRTTDVSQQEEAAAASA